MTLLLQYTLFFASVLTLVALGGCFSEHSGVINLGLEGIMVIGGMGGALTMRYIAEHFPDASAFTIIAMALLMAIVFGMIYSLLLAVASINFNADQTIVGTAMNMLATAAATVIIKAINTAKNSSNVSSVVEYIKPKEAFMIRIGKYFDLSWFAIITVILLVVAYITLYKTKFGLRLMACGEYPQAAASVGIDVYKMRYAGVLISGALGGIGGLSYITAGVSEWKFEDGVRGFGFLALAVMIFGQWKPMKIALAAILFGAFWALSNVREAIPFLASLKIPSQIYVMMPYIISLVVLAFTSKKSRAPKAEGIPYDKGQR